MARHVLDRHFAFAAGLLHSAACARAGDLSPDPGARRGSGRGSRFLDIFSPALLRITLLASLLAIGAQGGYYAITTWLPTYLKITRGLSVLNTGAYLCVVIAGSFGGYMVGAWLTDRLGRKRTLLAFAVGSLLAVIAYTYLPIGNALMLVLGFPLGFFASGSFSPIGAFFTELFPTRLRGSGQGFSYNVGRGIGALFPTLVGYLGARMGLGHAIAVFADGCISHDGDCHGLLPETRGRRTGSRRADIPHCGMR